MLEKEIKQIDDKWDNQLKNFQNWNIFQTHNWCEIVKEIFFPKAILKGIFFYEDNELIGMMPILKLRKYIFKIAGSPLKHLLNPFAGIAYRDNKLNLCLELLKKNNNFNIISFTQKHNEIENLELSSDYITNEHTTSIIKLNDNIEGIMKKMNSKTRNQIRKGEKNNFIVSNLVSPDIINSYLDIREKMYDRQKMDYKVGNDFINEVLNRISRENINLFYINHEENLISAAIFLNFSDIFYYWDGISDYKYNNLCPNNLLQWYCINWAKEKNFKYYDLGGTNTPSIAHFKMGFGGTTLKYTTISLFKPMILRNIWDYYKKISSERNPKLN